MTKTFYFNSNFKNVEFQQSGPYVLNFGIISVLSPADSTVGPILVNYYGCKKVSAAQAAAHLKKMKAESADEAEDAAQAEKAKDEDALKAATEKLESKPEDNM